MTISGSSTASSGAAVPTGGSSTGGAPPTRTCYVCGQQFGRNSLEPHEKKCRQFWQMQAESLPNCIKTKEPKKMQGVSNFGDLFDANRVSFFIK